jgi:NADH dehydrogenase
MATIGRAKAVADLPFYSFSGFWAWTAWLFVHLLYLQGFRPKLATLIHWAGNYFSYDRPLGLVIWPRQPGAESREEVLVAHD